MPSEPFDSTTVLYRFVPSEMERSQYRGEDKGVEEIVLVRGDSAYPFSLWGKWGEYWQMSPRIETLILRLFTDLAAVKAERTELQKCRVALKSCCHVLKEQAEKAEAERDTVQAELAKANALLDGR